jgi:c-di-GMP-binding flagellar brake protein YcgR
MNESEVARPLESSSADVTLITRGITVTALVDVSTEYALVVTPNGGGNAWKRSVHPGDAVEVFWVADKEERTLPAKIVEVEGEEREGPRWHLAPTGPSERSQRRKAVRARLSLPVVLPWLDSQLTGTTVDLSEAGMRALVDGWGVPPEQGTLMDLTIDLSDRFVDLRGELIWLSPRGMQWLIAMRFDDVSERDGDALRQAVFKALRAERAAQTAG